MRQLLQRYASTQLRCFDPSAVLEGSTCSSTAAQMPPWGHGEPSAPSPSSAAVRPPQRLAYRWPLMLAASCSTARCSPVVTVSTAFAFSHVVETRRPRQLLHQEIPVRRRHRPFDDWIPKGSATHSSPAGCCHRIVISIEIECRVRLHFILTPLKKERTPGSIKTANRQKVESGAVWP